MMQPRIIVQSFLDTLQEDDSNHRASSRNLDSGTRQGSPPSVEELLNPSVALRARLLKNPGLSDAAMTALLTTEGSRDSLNQDAVTLITDYATDDLVDAIQAHIRQAEKTFYPSTSGASSNLSTETIDHQAKARIIFQRLRDPSNPLPFPDAIHKLQEYLTESRAEALGVIRHLSDMATAASRDTSHMEDATNMDWSAFIAELRVMQA